MMAEQPTKNFGLVIVQLQNYQPEAHYAAKLKNGADMNLQPDECDQFCCIWWSLLSYVNKGVRQRFLHFEAIRLPALAIHGAEDVTRIRSSSVV